MLQETMEPKDLQASLVLKDSQVNEEIQGLLAMLVQSVKSVHLDNQDQLVSKGTQGNVVLLDKMGLKVQLGRWDQLDLLVNLVMLVKEASQVPRVLKVSQET